MRLGQLSSRVGAKQLQDKPEAQIDDREQRRRRSGRRKQVNKEAIQAQLVTPRLIDQEIKLFAAHRPFLHSNDFFGISQYISARVFVSSSQLLLLALPFPTSPSNTASHNLQLIPPHASSKEAMPHVSLSFYFLLVSFHAPFSLLTSAKALIKQGRRVQQPSL